VIRLGGFPSFGGNDVINHVLNLISISEDIRSSMRAFGILSVIVTAMQAFALYIVKLRCAHLYYI